MEIVDAFIAAPVACLIFVTTIGLSWIAFRNPFRANEWMLNPYNFVHRKKYFTIFTSGFIHGDIAHLAFNMLSFYFFAFMLEMQMASYEGVIGHIFFGIVYLLSIILANIFTIQQQKNNPSYNSLGASGAITAVIFSYILFEPRTKINLMLIPIGIPAPIFAILYIAFSIYASKKMRGNINHEAHISGAFSGIILTILLFPGIVPHFITIIQEMLAR